MVGESDHVANDLDELFAGSMMHIMLCNYIIDIFFEIIIFN